MPRNPTLARYHQKIAGSLYDPCVFCGGRANTVDHIEPIAKGGSRGSMMNIAPMCSNCNNDKGSDSILIALLTHAQLKNRIRSNIRAERKKAAQERIQREWLSK